MKISVAIKKLQALKKEFGDVEVYLNVKEIEQDEATHEDFMFAVTKLKELNADTGKLSRKNHQVIEILMDY